MEIPMGIWHHGMEIPMGMWQCIAYPPEANLGTTTSEVLRSMHAYAKNTPAHYYDSRWNMPKI